MEYGSPWERDDEEVRAEFMYGGLGIMGQR